MTVRQELFDSLSGINDVQVYGKLMTSPMHTPAVVIARGEEADTYQRQRSTDADWLLILLCSANDKSKIDDLDELIDTIRTWADDNEIFDTFTQTVAAVSGDEVIAYGEQAYLSATVKLRVLGG